MPRPSDRAIHRLCEEMEIEDEFLLTCLEESVVELDEIDGRLEFANATALRLRRLQRVCLTFHVDVTVGLLLMHD
jgi:hypothetical protein